MCFGGVVRLTLVLLSPAGGSLPPHSNRRLVWVCRHQASARCRRLVVSPIEVSSVTEENTHRHGESGHGGAVCQGWAIQVKTPSYDLDPQNLHRFRSIQKRLLQKVMLAKIKGSLARFSSGCGRTWRVLESCFACDIIDVVTVSISVSTQETTRIIGPVSKRP